MEIVYDNIESLILFLLIILLLQLCITLLNNYPSFSNLVGRVGGLKAAAWAPKDCEGLRKYRGEAFTETPDIEKGVA